MLVVVILAFCVRNHHDGYYSCFLNCLVLAGLGFYGGLIGLRDLQESFCSGS